MLQVEGFLFRQELKVQQQVSAAWFQAAWQRSKRMPALRTILRKMGTPRSKPDPKTLETAKAEFKTLVTEMTSDLNIKEDETDG